MKMTIAERNPEMELPADHTFCFSPDVLARASEMPMMTMSMASGRSQLLNSYFFAGRFNLKTKAILNAEKVPQ